MEKTLWISIKQLFSLPKFDNGSPSVKYRDFKTGHFADVEQFGQVTFILLS